MLWPSPPSSHLSGSRSQSPQQSVVLRANYRTAKASGPLEHKCHSKIEIQRCPLQRYRPRPSRKSRPGWCDPSKESSHSLRSLIHNGQPHTRLPPAAMPRRIKTATAPRQSHCLRVLGRSALKPQPRCPLLPATAPPPRALPLQRALKTALGLCDGHLPAEIVTTA